MTDRARAERWFRQTLDILAPRALVRAALAEPAAAAAIAAHRPVAVLALGKAAAPMLAGWFDAAPANAAATVVLAAPEGALPAATAFPAPVTAFAAGHPDPNPASLAAAQAMLAAARDVAAAGGLLVTLISGGGSALAEWPRAGGLERWRRLNRALVTSGAPIAEINVVRKHLSAFKGGQLAAAAAGAAQLTLVLSDVAGGDLSAVASGPTCPDPSTVADARAALRRWLPPELVAEFEPGLAETPKPGAAAFARSRVRMLADNDDACATLAMLARAAGRAPVLVDHTADEATSAAAAAHLAARWRALRAAHAAPCLIAGGEVRVGVPADTHGRGGRNTDLALRVARELAGEPFTFLSAGTDGVDGVSPAAGACVDGATTARARAAGLDPAAALAGFDSATLLVATGDLVTTGPTGNNLRDLRLFL